MGLENALYFMTRNVILQALAIATYFLSKRWNFVIEYMSVIMLSICALSNAHTLYSPTFYTTDEERENNAIISLANLNSLVAI
jgi:hypothetical protein